MKWVVLLVIGMVIVGLVQGMLRRGKVQPRSAGQNSNSTATPLVSEQSRLSNNQILCLSSASMSAPIYAENPSHMHSQMPRGAECFNQRTVDSLVKRGFLVSDQKGGYLLTEEGRIGLKRGMGFRN